MFWRFGQIRLKRQNQPSKMRDHHYAERDFVDPVLRKKQHLMFLFFSPFFAGTTSHFVCLPARLKVAGTTAAACSIGSSRALCSSNTRPSLAAGIPPPVLSVNLFYLQIGSFDIGIYWFISFGWPRTEKLGDS